MSETCPKKILIMPDYAPDAYAWDYEENHLIAPIKDYFPENLELPQIDDELSRWRDWFDRGTCSTREDYSGFPWKDFHEQGMALAKKLAKVVSQYGVEVYYRLPYEDPNGKGSEAVKITI